MVKEGADAAWAGEAAVSRRKREKARADAARAATGRAERCFSIEWASDRGRSDATGSRRERVASRAVLEIFLARVVPVAVAARTLTPNVPYLTFRAVEIGSPRRTF
jgi:hypothetical protein